MPNETQGRVDSNPAENFGDYKGVGNPNWVKGMPSPNPGGKPKKIVAIEKMLDEHHRDVDKLRRTYAKLRKAAHAEMDAGKNEGFTKLYLERIQGPVRELQADLTDAPKEVINWIAENLA